MDNSFAVDVAIGFQELSENGFSSLDGESVGITLQIFRECATFQEFHDKIDEVLMLDGVE